MKKKLILAALLMLMAVTVFAGEEIVWEEQTATEDVTYAESVFEEVTMSEATASEEPEYVFEEPATAAAVEEETKDEETVFEEIAFDQPTELIQEDSVFEEVVTEEVAGDEAAGDETAEKAVAIEGLVYTGEPQALILPQPGSWTYSLDGEAYSTELPTGVNAGEYTVYMKEGEAEAVVITVTIAKADVIYTAPVANTSTIIATNEPAEENEAGDENEEPDEVVFK